MFDKAKRISGVLVLRGLLSLVFGVLVLALPDAVVVSTLLFVFAVFAILDGLFAIVGSVLSRDTFEDWWLIVLAGALSLLIGVLTLVRPEMIAAILVMYIGIRAILQGMLEIAFAVRLRRVIEGEWLFILAGTISTLFGLVMIVFPIRGEAFSGVLVVAWLIGVYAIAGGAMQLVLAGQIREWVKRATDRRAMLTPPSSRV